MKVTGYKCVETGEIFENQAQLNRHMAHLKRKAKAEQELKNKKALVYELSQRPRLEATNLDHLAELLVECAGKMCKILKSDGFGKSLVSLESVRFTGTLNPDIYKNRHEKPVRTLDAPSGMVYMGDILTKFSKSPDIFDTLFNHFQYIHRGTGGGRGDGHCHHDVVLFLDDFPKIHAAYLKHQKLVDQARRVEEQQNVLQLRTALEDVRLTAVNDKRHVIIDQLAMLNRQLSQLDSQASSLRDEHAEAAHKAIPDTFTDRAAEIATTIRFRRNLF